MKRIAPLAAVLFVTANASAEPHVEVALDGRMGQSTAPYVTEAFPTTSGYGGWLAISGRFRVAERFRLGLRAPLVLMRVEQPAGALYAEAAWANPELSASFDWPWLEQPDWSVSPSLSLAIGAPLAEHDPAQLAGRALRLANAFEGFSEPALFTPGILPVTAGSSLTWEHARWKLTGALAVPLLCRVSDADLPTEAEPRSFALSAVVNIEARLRVLRWLSVAVSPRLTWSALAPTEREPASALQPLVAGRADFQVAQRLSLSAQLQAPLGGSLGGETVAGGFTLQSAF